jgi:hypothetical protein
MRIVLIFLYAYESYPLSEKGSVFSTNWRENIMDCIYIDENEWGKNYEKLEKNGA